MQSSLSTDRLSSYSLHPLSFFDLESSRAIASVIFKSRSGTTS
jgi:hypothetical protein